MIVAHNKRIGFTRNLGELTMPAAAGNRYNPHGRPRRLETELQRAAEAARHVARLIDRPGSVTSSAEALAERYRSGDRSLLFIDAAEVVHVREDRLEAEIKRRLFARRRSRDPAAAGTRPAGRGPMFRSGPPSAAARS